MNSIRKIFKIIAFRPGIRSVAALLSLLLFFLPAFTQITSEKNCQEATKNFVEYEAQRAFLWPFVSGRDKYDGPALKNQETPGGNPSLQQSMSDFIKNCRSGGLAICDDYARIRNARYGGQPPTRPPSPAMGTNPISCEITEGGKPVTEADAPQGGIERAIWFSEFNHEEYHQANCRRDNSGNTMTDDSPWYQKMRDPKGLAEEEYGAYGVSMGVLEDYLKKNCFNNNLKIDIDKLSGDCGDAPSGMIRLNLQPPAIADQPFRVRTITGSKILDIPDRDEIVVPTDGESETYSSSNCGCCNDETKLVPVYVYGGPDQSIMQGKETATITCKKKDECGSSSGDPHICTHDSLLYDFQGVGEFILAKTENFEVQARHQAIGKFASVNTAAAVRINDDRIAVYGGDPTRLFVNGSEMKLAIGDSVTLPGGAELRRDKRSFRVSNNDYVFEAEVNTRRMVAIRVNVPLGSKSGGLLGDRNDDRKDDIRPSGDDPLVKPVDFNDLYKKFGNSWRVSTETSLFDYADGESAESMAMLEFPIRRTKVSDFPADTRFRAEALCRKAGITDGLHLENCIYDIALTGDDTFADDNAGLPRAEERLAIKGDDPVLAEATTADGVKIELLSEAIASFPVEIRVSGPAPKYLLTFAKVGSAPGSHAGNAYSSTILKGGADVVTIHAPYTPGEYELRLVVRPGADAILLSIPFRSIAPVAELEAAEFAKAEGKIEVRVIGDVSPNAKINIVPIGSPLNKVGAHTYTKHGIDETVTVLYLPKVPGKYEIRYVSSTSEVIYARRELTIIK